MAAFEHFHEYGILLKMPKIIECVKFFIPHTQNKTDKKEDNHIKYRI